MVSHETKLSYGVPQSCVIGSILFQLYVSPISDIVSKYGVRHMSYADDTQIYLPFPIDDSSDLTVAVHLIESYLRELNSWL